MSRARSRGRSNGRLSGRQTAAVFAICALVAFGLGLGTILLVLRDHRIAEASKTWPVASGVVTSSLVTSEMSTGKNPHPIYRPRVEYDYTVDDAAHHGKTIRIGGVSYTSNWEAQRKADRYPVGARVDVRYDPTDPGRAVLEPGENGPWWILVGGGVVIAALGPLFGFLAWRTVRGLAADSPAAASAT